MKKDARARRDLTLGTFIGALAALGVFAAGDYLLEHPSLTHNVGTVVAVVGAVAAWVFVVTYWRRPWRIWAEGRHLMVFTSGMAAILTYVSILAVFITNVRTPHLELARLVVYAFITGMLLWRVKLLHDAGRDDDPEVPRG